MRNSLSSRSSFSSRGSVWSNDSTDFEVMWVLAAYRSDIVKYYSNIVLHTKNIAELKKVYAEIIAPGIKKDGKKISLDDTEFLDWVCDEHYKKLCSFETDSESETSTSAQEEGNETPKQQIISNTPKNSPASPRLFEYSINGDVRSPLLEKKQEKQSCPCSIM